MKYSDDRSRISRRNVLRALAVGGSVAAGVAVMAGCGETQIVTEKVVEVVTKEVPVERVVTQIVREEVLVEVEKVVTKTVKEVVVQEKVVTKIVEAATPMAKAVTIRFQDWGGDYAELVEKQGAPAFTSTHPNITVKYEAYASGWQQKTLTAMVAGTAPHILHVFGSTTKMFADRGQLANLTPFVKRDFTQEVIDDFQKPQWDAMVLPGTDIRFALPKHLWMGVLLYNKQMFEEAGVEFPTVDWGRPEYDEALIKLTRKDGDKIVHWGGAIPATSYDRVVHHVRAFGGNMVDPDDSTRITPAFDQPEALDALEWIRKRMWDDNTIVQNPQAAGKNNYALLMEGLAATIEEGVSWLFRLADGTDLPWDIAHHPAGPVLRDAHMSSNGWSIYRGVFEQGVAEETWELMRYLTSPEWQKIMLRGKSRAIVPARKSVLPFYVQNTRALDPKMANINLELIPEAVNLGYHTPAEFEHFKNQTAAWEVIGPVFDQIFVSGNTPVDALKNITEDVMKSQEG